GTWNPTGSSPEFGIWALIIGTLKITVIATIVAVPIGLGAAIYLNEYASDRSRRIIKPILEILAGIPTIVFGFFALTFVTH
ncbi:phosphate ABC transporter, permease protein PstA, partial [Haemophilus influenzae]|nr:phosphate ABC transporter, permease protein PstA [Haemophilus influenzae]